MAGCVVGDAREEAAYDRALGSERADALITDPPYCLLTRRRKGGDRRDPKGTKIERGPVLRFETVREYRAFTGDWLPKAVSRLRPAAPLAIWTNFLGKEPIRSQAQELGYLEVGELIWAKRTTEREGNELLLRVYETALVFSREPLPELAPADPPRTWCVAAGYDDEGEAARWGSHPNHKPFGVLEPLLRQLTRPGGLVLDPFAGSGSIPSAALRIERRAACIEIEPGWAARVDARLVTGHSTAGRA
jgi:site-specific DNA-methyltransferase (adenine-specific)